MDDTNAAASEGKKAGGLALIHGLGQVLEQFLARVGLVHEGGVDEVKPNERDPPLGLTAAQSVAEFVRISGARQTVRVARDLLERGDLAFGAVFENGEVFLLQ